MPSPVRQPMERHAARPWPPAERGPASKYRAARSARSHSYQNGDNEEHARGPQPQKLRAARGLARRRSTAGIVRGYQNLVVDRSPPARRAARQAHRPARSAGSGSGPCRDGGAGERVRSSAPRDSAGMVALVRSTGHGGASVALDPDHRPIDAGLQLAAPAVVQVERVEIREQGHRRSVLKGPASARSPPCRCAPCVDLRRLALRLPLRPQCGAMLRADLLAPRRGVPEVRAAPDAPL
jgi:hypothetical protein